MKAPQRVVKLPLVTEKGTWLRGKHNAYIFWVDAKANKIEIASAVEQIFKVEVSQVRTMVYLGKPKRLGRFEGKRRDWKKAVVTLKPDQKIEIFEQVI